MVNAVWGGGWEEGLYILPEVGGGGGVVLVFEEV